MGDRLTRTAWIKKYIVSQDFSLFFKFSSNILKMPVDEKFHKGIAVLSCQSTFYNLTAVASVCMSACRAIFELGRITTTHPCPGQLMQMRRSAIKTVCGPVRPCSGNILHPCVVRLRGTVPQ